MIGDKSNLFGFYRDTASLEQGDNTILEYIWIDGSGISLRSKTRVLKKIVKTIEDIP